MYTPKKTLVMIAGLLVGVLFTQATALAQAGASTNAKQNRIVGLWDVRVSLASCEGGDPFGGFLAMHKFELGGTGQVVPSTNPAGLSAHMLTWSHLGGNDYHWFVKFFRFNNGVAIGWNVIESVVSISGDEYYGSGVASFYDMDGNFVNANTCPSFEGTRFTGGE